MTKSTSAGQTGQIRQAERAERAQGQGAQGQAERNGAQGAAAGSPARPGTRRQRRWVPGVAAFLCLLIGLSDIVAIFRPAWHQRLDRINGLVPGTFDNVTISAYVIVGLLLLLLSHGLRRRKRRAWQAVIALLAFDIAIHFAHAPRARLVSAIVAIVVLVALVYLHDEFYAVGDPRTRWTALWVACGLIVADLAIGLGYLSIGHLAANYGFATRAEDVVAQLVGSTGDVQWRSDRLADSYELLTSALGLFTLVVTVYLFLRPAQPRARQTPADAAKIRALLERHGARDSLGYFALREDKDVIWSPSGKSAICYRVVAGVMLASGDPIGDPEAWPAAIAAFLAEAGRHAWRPAVMGCSELGAQVWCREGGLTALELGDEAVVNAGEFSLDGRAMRNVRQMVTRVSKAGYTAQVRRVREIPAAELRQVARAADSWRGTQPERGFSMALGRLGAAGDGNCVLVTAREGETLRAVLHFVPWGEDGLSLDLMRRDRSAAPGLNDFMIVAAVKAAPGLGVRRVSLNFAMFRAVLERGERIGAGPVLRACRSVLVFASRWFQIESLYKFNAKFAPDWQPRFFVFPGGRDAPRIAVAALQAEAFLVWPRLELTRHARRAARALRRSGAVGAAQAGGDPQGGDGGPQGGGGSRGGDGGPQAGGASRGGAGALVGARAQPGAATAVPAPVAEGEVAAED